MKAVLNPKSVPILNKEELVPQTIALNWYPKPPGQRISSKEKRDSEGSDPRILASSYDHADIRKRILGPSSLYNGGIVFVLTEIMQRHRIPVF